MIPHFIRMKQERLLEKDIIVEQLVDLGDLTTQEEVVRSILGAAIFHKHPDGHPDGPVTWDECEAVIRPDRISLIYRNDTIICDCFPTLARIEHYFISPRYIQIVDEQSKSLVRDFHNDVWGE